MANPGRKLARQNKRSTPEGKEALKAEKQEKQSAQPQLNQPGANQTVQGTNNQPTTRVFQRRAGNS